MFSREDVERILNKNVIKSVNRTEERWRQRDVVRRKTETSQDDRFEFTLPPEEDNEFEFEFKDTKEKEEEKLFEFKETQPKVNEEEKKKKMYLCLNLLFQSRQI